MDRVKSSSSLRLLLAVLACYRLSLLVTEDDGPADVFRKLRQWTDSKRLNEQAQGIVRGKWANIDDGIRCPYCVGVWAAFLLAILVYTGIGDFILLFLGIAGGQSVLQGMRKE